MVSDPTPTTTTTQSTINTRIPHPVTQNNSRRSRGSVNSSGGSHKESRSLSTEPAPRQSLEELIQLKPPKPGG